MKISKINETIAQLYDSGCENAYQVDEYALQDLSAWMIQETPTKYLPILENYDKNHDVILMLSKWMETEDEETGRAILERLRDLAVNAFEATIDDALQDYKKREVNAQEEARRDRSAAIYADNIQRI